MNSNAAPFSPSNLPGEVIEAINLLGISAGSLLNKAKEVILVPESQLFLVPEHNPTCDPTCDPDDELPKNAFQNIFHAIVEPLFFDEDSEAKDEFFLSLYALLVCESHYRQLDNIKDAAWFIRTLDINKQQLHTDTVSSSRVSEDVFKKKTNFKRSGRPTQETDEALTREYRRRMKNIRSIEEKPETGSMGQNQGYVRQRVEGNGDCGYTSFGITRKDAVKLLSKNVKKISEIIKFPVKHALLTEDFYRYLFDNGIVTIPHDTIHSNEQFLEQYSTNLAVQSAYIQYDVQDKRIDAGYAHPAVLQALAHIQNTEIHMWQLGNNGILVAHNTVEENYAVYTPQEINRRVDILFVNNNHFERLELSGYEGNIPENGIYPLKTSSSQKTKKNYVPLTTASSPHFITPYENEETSSRNIREAWLNYFNAEKTGCLKFLIDLYSLYSNYQTYKSGVTAVKYLFLKKVVDLYGKISLVSIKVADGIVIDETKLQPKKIFGKSEWEEVQTLFETLSKTDASTKPMVVILVTDDQVKQLVSFPEENTHFAFDIAESIYTSHQPLANNILQLRGINANVITFRSLRDIHPDIQRALANLVRQNPDIFLARTTEYIELANLVYRYSLGFFPKEKDHIFNFMKQRGYLEDSPAPADYFITENPDRLLALLFIAIAYETIERQYHGRLSFVFFNLLINFPRLNVGCVHDSIPNDLRRSFKAQGCMREIKEMNSESAMTRAISFFKDHIFSVERDIKPPLI